LRAGEETRIRTDRVSRESDAPGWQATWWHDAVNPEPPGITGCDPANPLDCCNPVPFPPLIPE
jgi:hypothetical protein